MPSKPPLTTALPNVDSDPGALRVVLFGMPDAGKSSLVGALVQASHTQDRILQGRLIDLTNGMAELWRRVYEDRQRETLEEIVRYPLYFEPYAGDPEATPDLSVMLYDCDGRVANDLLAQRKSLTRGGKSGLLARAVLDADALVLTIDASASDDQVETDFREFTRFLRLLESHRSREHAIGGLPVYLALTKCDRLIREPIPRAQWERKIALRQVQVQERFARHLGEQAASFGSLAVRIHPTAVRQPAFADAPAQPRAPYGVAELFNHCLRAAYRFREQNRKSDARLRWIVAGSAAFLVAAALAAFFLLTTGGPVAPQTGLADRVAEFEARDKPLPDRLTGDIVQKRAVELKLLRDHPDFGKLPDDKRTFVKSRSDEIDAHAKLREQLDALSPLTAIHTLPDLQALHDKVEQIAIPESASAEWTKAPPPAFADRQRLLALIDSLREGVGELRQFNLALRNKANDRLFESDFHPRWLTQVESLLSNEANPPFAADEPIKGQAYTFDEAATAARDWQAVRKRLLDVKGLATALGLLRDPPGPDAVLLINPIPPEASLNTYAATRLDTLKVRFPDYKTWSLSEVPDALQAELRKRVRKSYEQLLADSRRTVLGPLKHPVGEDTAADWMAVAEQLKAPAVQEWRELIDLFAHILDPKSPGPVGELSSFVGQKSFAIAPTALTVSIPRDLPQGAFTPGDTLNVKVDGTETATLRFRLDQNKTQPSAKESNYRYLLIGDGRLTFRHGDRMTVDLPLMKGTKEWRLTWTKPRYAHFGFDVVNTDPTLSPADSPEKKSIAEGVTITAEGMFPKLPALLR